LALRVEGVGLVSTAFTKGPWALSDKAGNITRDIVGADGSAVCSVWNVRHHMLKDPTPDTNLILAAPELYEALEPFASIAELRSAYSDKDDAIVCVGIKHVRNALAALAKARGEA
jgi:hypothetical protein